MQTIRDKSQDIYHRVCTQKLPLDVPIEEVLQKSKSGKLLLKMVDDKEARNEPWTRGYAFLCQKQRASPGAGVGGEVGS